MNNIIPKIFLLALFLSSCDPLGNSPGAENSFRPITFNYPQTFQDTTVVDNYFGLPVSDPYRWLEDENSSATQKWVQAQRSISTQFFDALPFRDIFKQRLTELWDYERFGLPIQKGNKQYVLKNNGLQDQDILYELITENREPQFVEVLNPNKLSRDKTTSLSDFSFSPDASFLAYQTSEGGSDWKTIYVQDMKDNSSLPDRIEWVKFSEISWYRDGFFYSRYPKPNPSEKLSSSNQFHQVYYHRLGDPQSRDQLIFADRTRPELNFSTKVSEDQRRLFLSVSESTSGNALYVRDLRESDPDFTSIIGGFENDFEVIGATRNNFLVLTNYKAPRQRVVQINYARPEEQYWEEIIPETADKLQEVHLFGNKLVAHYLHNVSSEVKIFDLTGKSQGALSLPEVGSITEFSGSSGNNTAYFSFTSFTQPSTIYQLDLAELTINRYIRPNIDFESSAYETRQVRYQSYDGTEIPMFIIHKKGLTLDGTNPTLLYGYGGFNISVLPIFNRTRLNLFPVMLENNGVCAVANIRGGGEFGNSWHESGTKLKKQNVFDDFQAAAEYLIANKYTSSEKLAIYGRSNGGLLVGACLTQRPDLYAVAIPAVGVLDMLRYHQFTIGWAWASDYGSSQNAREFDYLYAYSPLHNVVRDNYPATLITTADHDDRVVPAHSYKFAAQLQKNQAAQKPVIIRIDSNTGHGAGVPVSKRIEEGADVLSFIFYNMKQEIIYDVMK